MSSPPLIERAKPVSLFPIVFMLLAVGIAGFAYRLFLKPGVYMLTSEPKGASVYMEAKLICDETPCEYAPRTSLSKELRFEHPGYHGKSVMLPTFSEAWQDLLRPAVQLKRLMSEAEAEKVFTECQAQREEVDSKADILPAPCYRAPPIMPWNARQSGHCHVKFDLDAQGWVTAVRATGCTDEIFTAESLRAVRQWRYLPARKGGEYVPYKDAETRLTFRLSDERGNELPEPSRYADDPDHKH